MQTDTNETRIDLHPLATMPEARVCNRNVKDVVFPGSFPSTDIVVYIDRTTIDGHGRLRRPDGLHTLPKKDPKERFSFSAPVIQDARFLILDLRRDPGYSYRSWVCGPRGCVTDFSFLAGNRTTRCPDVFCRERKSLQIASRSPPNLRVCSKRFRRTSSTIWSFMGLTPGVHRARRFQDIHDLRFPPPPGPCGV
jgi:hypothetical protein